MRRFGTEASPSFLTWSEYVFPPFSLCIHIEATRHISHIFHLLPSTEVLCLAPYQLDPKLILYRDMLAGSGTGIPALIPERVPEQALDSRSVRAKLKKNGFRSGFPSASRRFAGDFPTRNKGACCRFHVRCLV